MFDDPAFPSVPPPPEDDSVRPMSFVAALLWAVGAHLLFLTLAMLVAAADESSGWDPVTWVTCQTAVYLLTLFFMLRVYAPEGRIRDFVGVRATQWLMVPLAAVIGFAVRYPDDWITEKLLSLAPPTDRMFGILDVFYRMSFPDRVAVAIAVAGVGSLVEEILFRGGIFTATRKKYSPRAVILVNGLLFALIHMNEVRFIPLTLLGMLLAYLRWASGSLLIPIVLHVTYNAVPFYELLRSSAPPEDTPTPLTWAAAGLATTLVAMGLTYLLSRTRSARSARRADG